jgi:hypothetical protein
VVCDYLLNALGCNSIFNPLISSILSGLCAIFPGPPARQRKAFYLLEAMEDLPGSILFDKAMVDSRLS